MVGNLERIDASAAADVSVQNKIKTTSIKCNVSSAADLRLKLDIENFNANASSSGELKVSGNTTDVTLSTSSAGGEADNLKVKSGDANASFGGEVSIHVTEYLTADASSGGQRLYKESPENLKKNTSLGGSMKKK